MTCVAPRRIAPILILLTTIAVQAQSDPPKPPPKVVTRQMQMAAGKARLDKKVDAKNAKPGDPVTAKLMEDIQCADGVLMPKDATLSGRVLEVQPSEHKGDSKLVLVFDELVQKGKPPIRVKVTLLGLIAPPVGGPDLVTGKRDMDLEGIPAAASTTRQEPRALGAQTATPAGTAASRSVPMASLPATHDQPGHAGEDLKDSSVPDMTLNSSIKDPYSGTVTSKGKNAQLPLWTQLRIAIIALPPNAVIK